jgi:hypothetical protein
MAITIYSKHLPYTDGHLARIVDEMQYTGAPTLRVSKFRDKLFALEGSHRLAACHALGLEPKLVILEHDCDDTLDEFYDKVSRALPAYEFTHAYILEVKDCNG